MSEACKPADCDQKLLVLPIMDIYLWLAVWCESKQQDRCQFWLMEPSLLSDTVKDPENSISLAAPLGKVCLATLERASINIYLLYLFSLALGLCIWREIHEERMLSVSCWISTAEVTKC